MANKNIFRKEFLADFKGLVVVCDPFLFQNGFVCFDCCDDGLETFLVARVRFARFADAVEEILQSVVDRRIALDGSASRINSLS